MKKITNDNREYYTFAEIITGLRKDYKVNQELLEKLHKYIKIVSEFDTKSNLKLSLEDNTSTEVSLSRLFLHVSRIPSSISMLIRDAMNKYTYNQVRWMIDNASFYLIEDSDRLYFNQNNHLKLEGIFQPKVLIDNQSEFASTYAELKSTKLFTLPSLYIEINPCQSLFIWGDMIYLSSSFEMSKKIDIEYIAKDDSISINSNTGYSTYFIRRLLETKIPKYEFPNEYISLLEENCDKTDDLFIEDKIGRKKENLQFQDTGKRLILTKK